MHERIRDALLGTWGRVVAERPGWTLSICVLMAILSVFVTVRWLEFRSDRSDLIDPNLSWNRRYAEYKEAFTRWDDLIVCIEGAEDDRRVDDLARTIADDLRRDHRVIAADAGFDVQQTGPRLFSIAPEIQFETVLADLERARLVTLAADANAALGLMLGDLAQDDGGTGKEKEAADDEGRGGPERLSTLLGPYLATLLGEAPDFSFLLREDSRWLPLVSEAGSGRLRFVQVQFAGTEGGIDEGSINVAWLRESIARHVETSGLVDVDWGVTGIPAIEADETAQSIQDSTLASIAAFILITVLMLVVFRGIVVPLLAAGSLLIGMTWSFGWLVLAVGHLQLLSVVFSVILLGLGIDFALHLVSRLELVQDEHKDLPSAVSRVFRGIGPGMLTGAITTAAAFGATALTQFKGMAEMGVIAGGGILLCLVAMLSCFPAGLALTGRWKRVIRHRPGGENAHFAGGRLDFADFHPRETIIATLVALLLLSIPAIRVRYDPNVLNLHPPGIESVEWERRIVEDDARSVWCALLETSAEAAPDLVRRLRDLPEISAVGAMGLLLPPDQPERAKRIAAVRAIPVPPVPPPPGAWAVRPDLDKLRTQLAAVLVGLKQRRRNETDVIAGELDRLANRVADALAASSTLEDAEKTRRFASLTDAFDRGQSELRAWVDAALAPLPPGPDDLPALLRDQWTDGDVWLVRVYPAADPEGRSILHPERLEPFITALRHIDANVFGPPVQIFESSELIKREYIKAAFLAVAAIFIVLLLDFRSLADCLCAMLPVSIGFVGTFGLMGLFAYPLNFANIIVLPLIFGIGVDAGVHVVHRWRAEPYGRPAGLSGGTGRGITLTMITTMIGFGCMLLAQHRGIRSLGFVMLAGLSVCLLACYLALPPVLRLRTRHWSRSE